MHLQAQAYLAAAGSVIPVDAHAATVIAGWNPDQTYWCTPKVRYVDEVKRWTLEVDGERIDWVRQQITS